ncbi:MAG: hypothetical protein ACO3O3_14000, partial [Ilumatobacteraceae bacterium]
AAQQHAENTIVEIEKTQPLDDKQKDFIHKHEALHAAHVTLRVDDSSPSPTPPVPAQANDDVAPVNELTPDTFVSVADAARPVIEEAMRKPIKVKRLNEKACLLKVKRRMYAPYKHDDEESRNYGVGNVNKRLFEGRDNLVAETISAFNDVYTFLKNNTVPWDTGTDMVNMLYFTDVMAGLRQRIAIAEGKADNLQANWDQVVLDDINRIRNKCLSQGKPDRSDPNDYPATIRDRFSVDIRVMPIPDSSQFDPRFGMTDDDIASLERQLDDVETAANRHVITEMIEPMTAAVAKLKTAIGDKGSIFRDSLIDNMVDVADRMARVNLSDDPVIHERIKDLQSLVGTYANNKDVLRSNQSVREKAAAQIDALCGQMQGLV